MFCKEQIPEQKHDEMVQARHSSNNHGTTVISKYFTYLKFLSYFTFYQSSPSNFFATLGCTTSGKSVIGYTWEFKKNTDSFLSCIIVDGYQIGNFPTFIKYRCILYGQV